MKFVPVDDRRIEAVYVETVDKSRDGVQKMSADGRPVWSVRCLLRDLGTTDKPELVEVAVPNLRSLAEVLMAYQSISFDNLKVFAWSMDGGRSGLAYSADGCSTKASRNGAAAKSDPSPTPVPAAS